MEIISICNHVQGEGNNLENSYDLCMIIIRNIPELIKLRKIR